MMRGMAEILEFKAMYELKVRNDIAQAKIAVKVSVLIIYKFECICLFPSLSLYLYINTVYV